MVGRKDLQPNVPYDTLKKNRRPTSNKGSTIVQRKANAAVPSSSGGAGNANVKWPSLKNAPIQAKEEEKERSWLDKGLDWFGKTVGKGVESVVDAGTNIAASVADVTTDIAGGVVGTFNEELGENIKEAGDSASDAVRAAGESVGDFTRDVVHGAIAGDAIEDPNLAQMAGMTAVSFIPVVGQIADVRDLASGIVSGDAGRIATSAAGFIPGAGDAAKHAGRAVEAFADGSKMLKNGGKAASNLIEGGGKTVANLAEGGSKTAANLTENAAKTGGKTAANATETVAATSGKTASNVTENVSEQVTKNTEKATDAANAVKTRKSPLNTEQQSAYEAARARGLTSSEAYYISTGKNPLNQVGSDYMADRETKKIMDYYQDTANSKYLQRQGTGTPQQVGSWTHDDVAKDMINNYIPQNKGDLPYIKDIQVEQNYLNGMQIPNNARGSSRVDLAITNRANSNVHVADLKTGNATYSNRQMNKNARNINGPNNANGYTFTHQQIKPQ